MADRLVTIAGFPNAMLAHMAKLRLEEEGIVSFLADEFGATMVPLGVEGVKLQVRESDAEAARAVLEGDAADRDDATEHPEEP